MKKISFITTGLSPDTKSIDFACYMASLTEAALTGVFLKEDSQELVPHREPKHSYFKDIKESSAPAVVHMDVDQGMRYFTQECQKKGIQSNVYQQLGNPVENAVHESRFSDLLIIGAEEISNTHYNHIPSPFIKQVISRAECPVIIAPAYFEAIDNIVFCYDGSPSSVFALKQFTYAFPQYAAKKVTILEVEQKKATITEKANIARWIGAYYAQIGFEVLEGNTEDELFKYFFMKTNTFIVMGAYGRDVLSSIFHQSAANTIIKSIDLPLFITHH